MGSGLRQDKKQRTRAEILANAVAIFLDRGIRGTRLADVARASRVSPATLFNYFPTKAALAEAWVRGEVEAALARMAREIGDHGLRAALRRLCRGLAGWDEAEREARQQAWAEAGRARTRSRPEDSPLVGILRREQERDRVRSDLSAGLLAEMLTDAIESGLIAGLRVDAEPSERARRLQARVDLVLDGIRKRNERVRLPRTGGDPGARLAAYPHPP